MIRMSNSENQPAVNKGHYSAEVNRVIFHPTEEEVAQGKTPQYGPYLLFLFKISDHPEYTGRLIGGICSVSRHPQSKLRRWLLAMGINMDELGEQLDESILLGKKVQIEVVDGTNGRTKVSEVKSSRAVSVASSAPLGFKPTPAKTVPGSQPAWKPAIKPTPAPKPFTPEEDVPF